jgi:signal transduction histidine kinase
MNPVLVRGDEMRLTQVLFNLLHNAAKYTEPGGRIDLTVEREGTEAVVHVRDTGMGIPRELLPRVFDTFTQGERSLDRSQGGLGLGLALVRGLVEMHGGSVHAASEGRGRGSQFTVRVPALPSHAVELPESSRPLPLPPRARSVGRW